MTPFPCDVLEAAAALARSDDDPDGQTTFAILRLGVPGPNAAALLDRARELIVQADQHERLARFDRLRAVGWSPTFPA